MPSLPSSGRARVYLLSICTGVGIFVAVYVIDALLARLGLRADATFIDDVLLGILVAVLVMTLEVQHQRELHRQEARIAMVAEMNHHIRNALQAIVYVNATNADREAAVKVGEAAKRIEWALREILPAEDVVRRPGSSGQEVRK